jgi:ribosomal protein S18 acetylase RimI-like enzyme
MNVSKALKADIVPIMELIRQAVLEMHRRKLFQWDDAYPNVDIITEDIAAGSLYKVTIGEKLAGIIVLNEKQSPEYNGLTWESNQGKFLVVHRLCIHPDFQGKGLAKKLMSFAEEHAVKNKYSSIRLDTFTLNQKALQLYDSLKYRRVGTVAFREKIFQCFEKVLT